MDTVELSILIVSYNTRQWLCACLASIYRHTSGVRFEVVVVDNASADGSAAMVRDQFPDVSLTVLEENIGFAGGVNTAARLAAGEYLLLLNPDTVLENAAVDELHAFAAAHPEYGVYGGRTLAPDGTLDPKSCWGLPTVWSMLCFGLGLSTAFRRSRLFDPESLGTWRRDTVREVGVVAGSLLLIPRRLWQQLNGFDPAFFMYGEDADLCVRAAKLGYRPVITPRAVVTHVVGASSTSHADKMIMVMKGKATFLRRHWPALGRGFGLSMLLLGTGVRAALQRVLVRSAGSQASPAAWIGVWRARGDWLPGYASPSVS